METWGSNVRDPNQQLEQAQLSIAELYQENRELRRQLAAKNPEVSAPQGREGNVTWLKRQLQEAQDMIVQLREAQRVSEEQNMKTPQGARSSPGENLRAEET
jgi:predicted RNase H-like nuclease (RuvC/YqgF family)